MVNSENGNLAVAAVDREIASGTWWLQFSPAIETAFDRDTGPERDRTMILGGIFAVVLYDIFLIHDWLALPDMFGWMAVLRLLIFTPAASVAMVAIFLRRNSKLREGSLTFIAILAVILPMGALIFSDSPAKQSYQYGTLLIMMFLTVIERVQFRYAVLGLTTILAIQMLTTSLGQVFSPDGYAANVLFFTTVVILLLLAAYTIDRENRRSYLFALRGRLLFEQVERAARVDALTGLLNRRSLAETGNTLWAQAAWKPSVVCAILIDLDHFKLFNDSYGHLEGDTCLKTISRCIETVASKHDALAFRFGGEEMLVLVSGTDPFDARQIAVEIADAIRAAAIPHRAVERQTIVSASMGVAGVMAPETSFADLLSAADTALYAAKRAGRNCIWPPLPVSSPDRPVHDASAA